MYFIYSFSFIKRFFIRINFNKFKVKLLFYCFLSLYFIINISIILSKFINFYCKLVIVKTKINSVSQNNVFTLHIFSLKYFFIDPIIVCCLVLITSLNLNPSFILNVHDSIVLQSIIIFIAKSSYKIKFCLSVFLVHPLIHIYVFYGLIDIFL